MRALGIALFLSVTLWGNTFYYECHDGYNFTARFEKERVWLFLPRQSVELEQVRSASGAKYANGEMTLFTKGEEALFAPDRLGGELTCKNNKSIASVERSKRDGFDFRGSGNEPGWELELGRGLKSRFVYDYGKRFMEFDLPKPRSSGDSTLYVYKEKKNTLLIELHNRRCFDTMSGERHETTVWIKLNGRTFSGCGDALH